MYFGGVPGNVAIRRGQYPHVDFDFLIAADPAKRTFL